MVKEILISVAGLTPQVITETLYYLTQVKVPPSIISEIYIITTKPGKEKVLSELLAPETGKFYQFCLEYGIDHEKIKFDESSIIVVTDRSGRPIQDIRTSEDNIALADFITKFIREKTSEPDTVLHCSVAGGRKTMSILLASALQLFGRPHDTLSHVLVSEGFESHPDFFYIPKERRMLEIKDEHGNVVSTLDTKDAKIELAEVPYLRFRHKLIQLFGSEGLKYERMVEIAQREIDAALPLPKLLIDTSERKIYIGSRSAVMRPLELAIYLYFVRRRIAFSKSYSDYSHFETVSEIFEVEGLNMIKKDYEKIYRGKPPDGAEKRLPYKVPTWRSDILHQYISKINRTVESLVVDARLFPYYRVSSKRAYGATRYGILLDPSKIEVR